MFSKVYMMEQKDIIYILFWSFVIALALFFTGFGEKVMFFFCLSLIGIAFAERMKNTTFAVGAVFLALAFAVYFGKTLVFIGQIFVASLLFLLLPFILFELRKKIKK